MQSLAIVSNLNVFEDRRIVVAVAPPAHADLTLMGQQSEMVGLAGVLATLIRVMQKTHCGAAFDQSHQEGRFD